MGKQMSDRIAAIVERAMPNAIANGHALDSMTASAWTEDLLMYEVDLEGARFDDVYPSVMAYLLTHGGNNVR